MKKNIRKNLNFGHTFGHALELMYSLPHGIAIYWGMFLILKLFGPSHLLNNLYELNHTLDLNEKIPPWSNKSFSTSTLMNFIAKDKKRINQKELEIILIQDIGKCLRKTISFNELERILNKSQLNTTH